MKFDNLTIGALGEKLAKDYKDYLVGLTKLSLIFMC